MRRKVRELLEDLTDPDDCWYDHHGYCQAHGWMAPDCPHARAKRLLGISQDTNISTVLMSGAD